MQIEFPDAFRNVESCLLSLDVPSRAFDQCLYKPSFKIDQVEAIPPIAYDERKRLHVKAWQKKPLLQCKIALDLHSVHNLPIFHKKQSIINSHLKQDALFLSLAH